MKTTTVIFAALALTATVVQARELPTCNSAQAVELLASVIRPQFIVEVDDHEQTENNAKKRLLHLLLFHLSSQRPLSYGQSLAGGGVHHRMDQRNYRPVLAPGRATTGLPQVR
jgi:hypothetical protein